MTEARVLFARLSRWRDREARRRERREHGAEHIKGEIIDEEESVFLVFFSLVLFL